MPTPTRIKDLKPKKSFQGLERTDRRGYHTPRWRAMVKWKKSVNPICEMCKRNPTHTIDHKIPVRLGGEFYDEDNLQSLCKRCNAIKTSKQQKEGGYKR